MSNGIAIDGTLAVADSVWDRVNEHRLAPPAPQVTGVCPESAPGPAVVKTEIGGPGNLAERGFWLPTCSTLGL